MHKFLKIVSPRKVDGTKNKPNMKSNKKVIKAAESWITWRNAMYKPVVSKYPTTQQLKRKHDEVAPAAKALFEDLKSAFDNHVTPYMHHMLHTENLLKRDVLDRSGESLEHKNKKFKGFGVHTSHQLPSAENRCRAVCGTVLQRQSAYDECTALFTLPPSRHEIRREREQRKAQTVYLVPYSDSDSDS